MARGNSQPAAASNSSSTDSDQLPTCDGSQLSLSQWLRDLEGHQHLFDSDVTYFLVTATAISSQCKTAVLSPEHSRLLDQGVISAAKYSVLKPPPIEDAFRAAYADVRKGIADGSITHLVDADVPATVPSPPDTHLVAPDRLMQVDMKLRNNLLSLITSTGRRRHYQALTLSGCCLLYTSPSPRD